MALRSRRWAGLLLLCSSLSIAISQDLECTSSTDCTEPNTMCSEEGLCECSTSHFTPTGSISNCRSTNEVDPACASFDENCVYCGRNYEGPCMKCTTYLIKRGDDGDTDCIDDCGAGDDMNAVLNTILNGSLPVRECVDSSQPTNPPLPTWAIIVVPVLASLVLVIAVIIISALSCILLNRTSTGSLDVASTTYRVDQAHKQQSHAEKSAVVGYTQQNMSFDLSGTASQESYDFSEENEEEEFMHKLEYLRKQAETFLKMLNDMRKRLKELPADAPAAKQYRNVMRDITRLLYLLNKKPSAVEMPPDGLQLLKWSEKTLNRYLLAQGQMQNAPKNPNRISSYGAQVETKF